MRAHIIENGLIVNTIEIASLDLLGVTLVDASIGGGIGWGYTNGVLSEPVIIVEVPQVVSRFQAKAALNGAGVLSAVESMMADPATDIMVKLAWQDATEFRRDSPTVAFAAGKLNLTSSQIDDLFIQAAQITA